MAMRRPRIHAKLRLAPRRGHGRRRIARARAHARFEPGSGEYLIEAVRACQKEIKKTECSEMRSLPIAVIGWTAPFLPTRHVQGEARSVMRERAGRR